MVFAADDLPFIRAKGGFVPEVVDEPAFRSLDPGEVFDWPMSGDQPPLNPPGDWSVGAPVHIVPVGGRLRLFVAQWQAFTRDHFILSVVRQGFQISVQNNFPGVLREITVPPRDQEAHLAICKEIRELILKQAIVQIDDFPLLCLSPIFMIPKKSGDLRVILNLKKINVFISVQHFRMETLNVILPNLRHQDWAVSIDLKDAYLHVPVHPQSRILLGFKYLDKTYVYKVLPFGLKDSVGLFADSSYGNSSPSPARHPDILLSGRLADRCRVPVAPSVTPSGHSSVGQGLGVHRQSSEVDARPSEDAHLPRSLSRHPQVDRTSGGAQSGGSSVAHSGTYRVAVSSCSPVAEGSMPFGQFRGSGSELQASHAASSVALPSILVPPVGLSVETDSVVSGKSRFFVQLGVLRFGFSKGSLSPPPPPSLPSADLSCLPVRLGHNSPASSGVRHLVQGGVLGPYQLPQAQGSVSGPAVSRGSCHMSVSSGSLGQHNSRVLYQFPGRNSLPLSLSSSIGAVGVVHSEGDPSIGRSYSGGRQPGGGLFFQREVSSVGMDTESFCLSEDLPGSSTSSGDRSVCVHPQFSTSQVLCPLQGSEGLEGGRTLLPVVGSSVVCLPTFLDPSHSSGEGRSGRSGPGSSGPLLASETMVPEVVISSGGTAQSSTSTEGPCLSTHVSSTPSETRESTSHTLTAFREKGKQAGLSARATEFAAEALREST